VKGLRQKAVAARGSQGTLAVGSEDISSLARPSALTQGVAMTGTRLAATSLATAVLSFAGWLVAPPAEGRNLMTADGPGGTYELLQGAYTVEVPDCGHMVPHITEEMDEQLGKNVFVFHAHVNEDNDRCQNFDRQR